MVVEPSYSIFRFSGVCIVRLLCGSAHLKRSWVVEPSYPIFLNFGVGDGTSTHVLVEHAGKLKMTSKSYNLQSQINPSRGCSQPKLLIRRLSRENNPEENQSLEVVRPISANFTVLTESMTKGFQKLGGREFKGDL